MLQHSLISQTTPTTYPPKPRKPRVCLVTMGSYPHYAGGVSTWCDMLVAGLPEVSFDILSITASPGVETIFPLPANVRQVTAVPLWGAGEVLEWQRDLDMREVWQHKHNTSTRVIANLFVPLFRRFLQQVWAAEPDPATYGRTLWEMARYFARHDYDVTMRSAAVWDCFMVEGDAGYNAFSERLGTGTAGRLMDATDTMRLLYRWLSLLTLPTPPVDVMHTALAGLCGIPAIVAREGYGIPFLLTEHGVYLRERLLSLARHQSSTFDQAFQAQFDWHLTAACYHYADKITPGSNYNHRWELQNGARPEQIQTIYNGSDPADFKVGEPLPDDHPPTIVFLGRIDPLKDIETLIRAAALVHQTAPEARFVLYGKAPRGNEWYYEKCLNLRRELGVEDSVEFAGFAETAESAYHAGDFVVLSSISEGFPYSVVEAMMCGRTVVGTAVGGVPEALAGCGLVVQPRDPHAMAEACLTLINNRELTRELGEKARHKSLTEFSLQQCNTAYLQTYRDLWEISRQRAVAPSLPKRRQTTHLVKYLVARVRWVRRWFHERTGTGQIALN